MFAVIGLGNPGKEYRGTRHNVGFDTIDCLAQRNGFKLCKIKHKAIIGEGMIGKEKTLLVKPQTFMNNSGLCVLDLYNYYKLPIENIIIVVDDIDINFGTLRIRKKGSAGSHNGMKSILYHLQSENFPRIRIGVGQPEIGMDLADFVLSGFTKEERNIIDETIERAAISAEEIIVNGIDKAMNEYNG